MAIDHAVQLEFEFVKGLEQKDENLKGLVAAVAAITTAVIVLPKLYDYLEISKKLGSLLAEAEAYIMQLYF